MKAGQCVFVVMSEWTYGSESIVEGVSMSSEGAESLRKSAIARYVSQGQVPFTEETELNWDFDVVIEQRELTP